MRFFNGDVANIVEVLNKALDPNLLGRYFESTWISLNNRRHLAEIHRELGQVDRYEELKDELEHLLQMADEDHPILTALREVEQF